MSTEKPRLVAQVKSRMRARHLSPRTEQAYLGWILRYIRYHCTRHPAELGESEVIAYLTYLTYLTYLAAERRVSRSTPMQALSALLLLYREVLAIPMGDLSHAAPLVRDASAGRRVSHPDAAGAAGPLGREHDDDLHARAEPGSTGGSEPGGPAGSRVMEIAAVLAGRAVGAVRFLASE